MTDTKHTPGEWVAGHMAVEDVDCNCRSIVSEEYAGAVAVVPKNNGLATAEGGNDCPPEAEAIANAHLIAAAPELLEALENCQSILAHLIDPNQKGSGIDNMVAWARCVESEKKARNAIAKAKGGE